jgi:hypothetical protein
MSSRVTKRVREILADLASLQNKADMDARTQLGAAIGPAGRAQFALGVLSSAVPERAALLAEALGDPELARDLRALGDSTYAQVKARRH